MNNMLQLIAFWIVSMTPLYCAQINHQSDTPMHVEFSQSGDSSAITSSKRDNVHRTTLELRSERGIGNCKIDRKSDKWPEEFMLRLHLRGLEQIIVHVGDKKWIGSVSSAGGIVRWSRQAKDATEQSMDSSDPSWCPIRVARLHETTDKGETEPRLPEGLRVPLEEGECWEMSIPAVWLKENPASIRISWIDFFR